MADLRIMKVGAGFALVAMTCTVALGEGSELPDLSVVIGGLPYSDSGDTSDNSHEADAICPFGPASSPDVYYAYTTTGETVSIDLCSSLYDTKVFVLDTAFNVVGCSDDACGSDGFKSALPSLALAAGTYHITVDGWSGSSGAYNLTVSAGISCDVNCSDTEGEPCGTDTNGGCNSTPNVFGALSCGDTVCGNAWADASSRDTEWYQVSASGDITWSCDAELPVNIFILNNNCAAITLLAQGTTGASCGSASCTLVGAASDTYVMWLGCTGFAGFPCGTTNDYQATVDCDLPCPLDLDGSGEVGFGDVLLILNGWGPCP